MSATNPRTLQHITTSGRKVVTRDGDLAAYQEQWQILLFFIFAMGLLVMLFQLTRGQVSAGDVNKALQEAIPLIVYSIGVLAAGFVLSWRRMSQQGEIKIIGLNDQGIKLGTKKFQQSASQNIPWQNLEAIEVIEEIDKGGRRSAVYLSTYDVKVYKLKWENAFAWEEPESFFTTLRAKAPHTRINYAPDRIAQIGDDDSRYTNLWLQYFSTPGSRQRKGVLPPGVVLNNGKYRVLKRMGGGGQGTVYLAAGNNSDLYGDMPDYSLSAQYDSALLSKDEFTDGWHQRYPVKSLAADGGDEKLVVLKEYILPVHRGAMLEERHYELLNSEAEILSRINHPRIVRMLDCFVEDHRGYLVLEYVDGESLRSLVSRTGPLPEAVVREAAVNICEILTYLHDTFRPPIVHRDLTPDNLLCDKDGVIKLIDFTIARQFEAQRTATVAGKQSYISPEQFRGAPVPASDVYSLGCTMHYLLTGRDPEPISQSRPALFMADISPAMDEIVATATALDTKDRYASAAMLKSAIEHAHAQ